MSISSAAFPGESIHSISHSRVVDSSSGVHASLSEWTHFESSLRSSLHGSENDTHNILKELLTDEHGMDVNDNGAHALLKQILNDKAGDEGSGSKQLRLLLGEPQSISSPTGSHQDQSAYMQNQGDFHQNSPISKRKIEEIDGADPGNAPKLAEKNKMLAALLRTPRGTEVPPMGLPAPNPGDLPQNKLPKDLTNRILPPPGQQRQNAGKATLAPGNALNDLLFENEFFTTRSTNSFDPMDSILDLVEDLAQDAEFTVGDMSVAGGALTANEKQAIANIRHELLLDFPNGISTSLQQDAAQYRETLSSPVNMSFITSSNHLPDDNDNEANSYSQCSLECKLFTIQTYEGNPVSTTQKIQDVEHCMHFSVEQFRLIDTRCCQESLYSTSPGHTMVRGITQNFTNSGDGNCIKMQRMPSGHLMLPNQGSPPSRPGIPADFVSCRSPVPFGATANSQLKQQLKMQAYQRQMKNNNNLGQPNMMQLANAPSGPTLQRSVSIPDAANHGYAISGYQNVPQNNPQFASQQPVVYSPPPQSGMRFPALNSGQPLSPRHPNAQTSRMVRPNMWMQSQQISGMATVGPGPPSSSHVIQTGNHMNMTGQQNPPPYSNQHFINQTTGQTFTHPSQMMHQNPGQQSMQARFQNAAAAGHQGNQFSQQAMIQQEIYGAGNAFYQRGGGQGMPQRLTSPGHNPQLMRTGYVNTVPDESRQSDGSFNSFHMIGTVNSAPPTLNPQQPQFRWDHASTDRTNMSMSSNPGLSISGTQRSSNSTMSLDPSFQQFESFFDVDPPQNPQMNGLGNPSQAHHMNDQQQFRPLFVGDPQQVMAQHLNQHFAPSSSGDLIGIPGSSPVHQHLPQGDRKSLLQQLLSDNST